METNPFIKIRRAWYYSSAIASEIFSRFLRPLGSAKKPRYRFALSLQINDDETIERRLLRVIEFIWNQHPGARGMLHDIEATGKLGLLLTDRRDASGRIEVSGNELIQLLHEDGQVFEFDLTVKDETYIYLIIVRRGSTLDVLSNNFRISTKDVVGAFEFLSLRYFRPIRF